MSEYTKRKWFTIHKNDAGSEAYRDGYVKWLEEQLAEARRESEKVESPKYVLYCAIGRKGAASGFCGSIKSAQDIVFGQAEEPVLTLSAEFQDGVIDKRTVEVMEYIQ